MVHTCECGKQWRTQAGLDRCVTREHEAKELVDA